MHVLECSWPAKHGHVVVQHLQFVFHTPNPLRSAAVADWSLYRRPCTARSSGDYNPRCKFAPHLPPCQQYHDRRPHSAFSNMERYGHLRWPAIFDIAEVQSLLRYLRHVATRPVATALLATRALHAPILLSCSPACRGKDPKRTSTVTMHVAKEHGPPPTG